MDCKHYWVCGQPIEGYVESVCRKCGEIRRWETLVSIEHKKSRDIPGLWDKENISPHDETDHTDDLELVKM